MHGLHLFLYQNNIFSALFRELSEVVLSVVSVSSSQILKGNGGCDRNTISLSGALGRRVILLRP